MTKLKLTLLVLGLTIAVSYGADENIFKLGIGLEKPLTEGTPNNRDFDSNEEFIAYGSAFKRDKDLLTFTIPADVPAKVYHFSGLGPFSVNGTSHYRLSLKINKLRRMDVGFVFVSFFNGEKSLGSQQLIMIPATQASVMMGYFVDFATPAKTDKLVIWFGLSGNGKNLKPGTAAILSDIKLSGGNPVKQTPEGTAYTEKNLSPVYDFENQNGGKCPDWDFMKTGGPTNKVDVDIAAGKDGKSLHIIKSDAGKYSWFHFRLPEGNFYYGNLFRFSVRLRGTGKARLGIWWRKAGQDYEYCNSEPIKLTSEWQDLQYEIYCNDPGTTSAAIAICMNDCPNVEAYADDFQFVITSQPVTKQVSSEK